MSTFTFTFESETNYVSLVIKCFSFYFTCENTCFACKMKVKVTFWKVKLFRCSKCPLLLIIMRELFYILSVRFKCPLSLLKVKPTMSFFCK